MKFTLLSVLLLLCAMPALTQQQSADGEKVWWLEETYWRDVKANDLDHYRSLWHPNFLGWPSVSPEPLRKAQITKWITDHNSKGESLKSYELERLILQQTNALVTTTYRVRLVWADKNGAGSPQTTRIIHTWVKGSHGQWQIISGMSAPTNADGH
jgi:ketosteroid isomerase-like protein